MLKILVPIKKVVDYNVQVRPTSDNKSVDIANVNRLAFASSLISEDLIRLSSLSNSKSQCVITKCNVMSYNTKLWGANMGL